MASWRPLYLVIFEGRVRFLYRARTIVRRAGTTSVLLVEDDIEVCSSLAALLEGWDYRVVQAANSQEALHSLISAPAAKR